MTTAPEPQAVKVSDRIWTEIHSGIKPVITLSREQRERAEQFGHFLYEKAVTRRTVTTKGAETDLDEEPFFFQALGDLVFSMWLGIPWEPDETLDHRPTVGGWYVRARRKPWHGLGVYRGHPMDGFGFVLVTPCMSKSDELRRMILHGWLSTDEVRMRLRELGGSQGSVVIEQRHLRPMSELPKEPK